MKPNESQTAFDPGWMHGHTTRDGRPVRVLCANRNHGNSVVALVTMPGGLEEVLLFDATGKYASAPVRDCEGNHKLDLVNVPPPVKKILVERWMNVWPDGGVDLYHSPEQASFYRVANNQVRIACVHIRREVVEDEGLTR
jgi:hypothetical protein